MTIDAASVFVVSGGARGVTARCVVELAARFGCSFVLLGRTPRDQPEPTWATGCGERGELRRRLLTSLPSDADRPTPARLERQLDAILARREIDATLRAVAQAGGRAEYVAVDITDLAAVQRVVQDAEARLGAITGLIHGAGVLRDRSIEQKTAEDLAAVYAAKVVGLENLLRCLPATRLRHLVLFSSAAGFYGNVGQTDYALANDILNKAAHLLARRHPECRVLAVDWGPWDGGMVGPDLKRLFEARGIPLIAPSAGARVLADELAAPRDRGPQILVGAPLMPSPVDLPPEPLGARIQRTLTLAANPFLHDHVIGEHAVLPFACALSWVASSCEQILPGYRLVAVEGFRLLKGIVFDDQFVPEITLDLAEQSRQPGRIRIDAHLWSQTPPGRPRHYYRGTVELRTDPPPAPAAECPTLDGIPWLDGASLYEDGTLFHGSRLRGVERVYQQGPRSLMLVCRLPRLSLDDQGQFATGALEPFFLDQQLQGMVIWARQALGSASLPTSVDRLDYFTTPGIGDRFFVAVEIESSSESSVRASLTAFDAAGRVQMRLAGAALTVSPSLNARFAPHGAISPVRA